MNYENFETDLDEVSDKYLERMKFTGATAIDHLLGRKNIDEQEGAIAYANFANHNRYDSSQSVHEIVIEEDWDIPEGDQEIYLLKQKYIPSSFPFGSFNLAEIDVTVEDYRKANPRKFAHELENDHTFRNFLDTHLSSLKKQDIGEQYNNIETPWN